MSTRNPRSLSDLEGWEREAVLIYRSLAPHRRPAWRRMGARLANGVSGAEAKRLCHQEMAVADARHRLGRAPEGEVVKLRAD